MPTVQDITHDEPGAKMPRHRPDYSDLCEICGPRITARRDRKARVDRLLPAMREFGYPVDRAEVEAAYDIAIARPATAEDGILATLIRSQLVEAGIVE